MTLLEAARVLLEAVPKDASVARLLDTVNQACSMVLMGEQVWRVTARPPKGRDGSNWQLRYFPPPGHGRPGKEGQPYQRSAGTACAEDAVRAAEREERRLNGSRLTFLDVIERHVAWREADPEQAPNTLAAYRTALKKARSLQVARVSKQELLEARDALRADGLAPRTVNLTFALWRKAWAWALERGLVDEDWPRIRRLREPPTKRRPCTPAELEALLDVFRVYRGGEFYPYWLLLAELGARRGEVHQLREEDLDRESGVVTFRAEVTKTRRKRLAHVAPEVLELVPRGEPGRRLFSWSPPTLTRSWKHAIRVAGLDGEALTPHSLRRAWITDAFEAELPLNHIMRQVGHVKAQVTLGYQANARDQRVRESALRVRAYRDLPPPQDPPQNCGGGSAKVRATKEPQVQDTTGCCEASARVGRANCKWEVALPLSLVTSLPHKDLVVLGQALAMIQSGEQLQALQALVRSPELCQAVAELKVKPD